MLQSGTKQYHILIIDDKPENLAFLTEVLSFGEYQIASVTNGQAGLMMIRETLPDLIILDIMMPEMDGYEVCRQLKADETTRNIPVLFISALDKAEDKVKAFQVGGVDYITKPFEVQEVLARVETHLTLMKMQRRLQENNAHLQQELSERKQAEKALQQRNQELLLLNRTGQMFSSSLELDQVLETALKEVQRLLDVVSTSFWLIDPETQELVCKQIIGPGSDTLIGIRLPPGQGITGWVAQHGESVISPNILTDERHHKTVGKQDGNVGRSMLSAPLRVKGSVIGVLNLVDQRIGHFTQNDLILLESIAAAAAIAIENARLYTTAQQEIAERKEAEAALLAAHNELKQKNAQLQELNASKDKFFSIISHDLRNPFNTLLGFAQLLVENVDRYDQDEIKHKADRIHSSADRLYALLENLLTWSRIQRGIMEHHPELIDLSEIAEDNTELFSPKAEQKQIMLSHIIPEKTFAYADYSMVDTVLRNLVSNALKFTQAQDRIEISARSSETSVEIAVADTGVGINQEDISKLFRIDVQHTKVGTEGETGTGLGLALCQDLVERNGGKIWVESEVGKGTTFTFTLPKTVSINEKKRNNNDE